MIDDLGGRVLIGDAAHTHALASGNDFIGQDSCVDGLGGVDGVLAYDFEFHVILFPAQEIDAGLVFPLEPLAKVDACAIPDIEDFTAFGGTLAEGLGGLPLERAHLVFFLALDLIGDGEVVHAVTAQVQGVEVPGGVFGGGGAGVASLGFGDSCGAWLRFVMAGGSDEMPIPGMDIEVIKAFVRSKGIGHDTTHAIAELTEDFID